MLKDTRKPRILWACRYCLLDTSSGGSMSILEILKQLRASDWDVKVFGATIFDSIVGRKKLDPLWNKITESKDKLIIIESEGLEHNLTYTDKVFSDEMTLEEITRWFNGYIGLINTFKPDIVFMYGGSTVDLLLPHEARIRQIPVLAYLVNENYRGTRWCRDINLIITDTKDTADFYKQREGLSIHPIGKFIDSTKILAEKHFRKRVLFVNPSWQKGAGIVALLAIILEHQRPDIIFEIVESRGNWDEITSEIFKVVGVKKHSLKNVMITPNTDDMRPVYARARVLLVPSVWRESGARVIAEAMINGIPVIATMHGGNKEMAQEGGIYFTLPKECLNPPYNQLPNMELLTPVVQKIIQLFDDQNYYEMYSKRAFDVGKRQFDIKKSTSNLLNLINPLIEQRAGNNDYESLIKSVHHHPDSIGHSRDDKIIKG